LSANQCSTPYTPGSPGKLRFPTSLMTNHKSNFYKAVKCCFVK
jgi:hypothetical protein